MGLRELPAPARRSVLASAVPCIRRAPHRFPADVRLWEPVQEWEPAPVVRRVLAACWAPPLELRLRAQLPVPEHAPERLRAGPVSGIKGPAASRKAQ